MEGWGWRLEQSVYSLFIELTDPLEILILMRIKQCVLINVYGILAVRQKTSVEQQHSNSGESGALSACTCTYMMGKCVSAKEVLIVHTLYAH